MRNKIIFPLLALVCGLFVIALWNLGFVPAVFGINNIPEIFVVWSKTFYWYVEIIVFMTVKITTRCIDEIEDSNLYLSVLVLKISNYANLFVWILLLGCSR